MSKGTGGENAPLASVVVPNRNGAHLLGGCLMALSRQELRSVELVIVDNASSDGSVGIARAITPVAEIVGMDANTGFAISANAGVARAHGRYVALLNNDAEPRADWLRELVACLERHPRAASVASRVLQHRDPSLLDGAGDELTRSLKAYRRGQGEPDGPEYDVEQQVFAASGTACLWRTEVFRELGGFDEDFFAYYEDVDLGLRARLAGYECWYAPRAVVLHRGGATAGSHAREFESYYAVRNRWLMTLKSVPRSWLTRDAHVIAVGEALSFSRSVLAGGGARHAAAYVDVARSLRRVLVERRRACPDAAPGRAAARARIRRRFPPVRSTLSRR